MSDDARNAYAAQRRASMGGTLEQVARGVSNFSGPDLLGNGEGLVITVLGGGRPQLMAQTMLGIRGLLEALPRVQLRVFLNQEDAQSEALVHGPVLKNTAAGVSPIGAGYTALAQAAEGSRWWLHVEDDWTMCGIEEACHHLRAAVWALDKYTDVEQVRLRHWKERVLTRHMVTGRPITWSLRDGVFPVAEAHWTLNPALARGQTATRFASGVDGEQDAQRKIPVNAKIIQSIPGVFLHAGETCSLRTVVGGGPDAHGR